MPYQQILQKNMLIRVFLHAELISAMKTVQNHTIFMKNAQNYSFYPKFVHFSEIVLQNFIFSVKSTIFLYFRTKCTFYPKFVHFSEIFLAKTSFLV